MSASVFVPGVPRPKGSKFQVRHRNGKISLAESADRSTKNRPANALKRWTQSIIVGVAHCLPSDPLEGPIALSVDFYLPKPKKPKCKTAPISKPDTDKLGRAVQDALEQAGAFHNDSQIVDAHFRKFFVEGDNAPGAAIAWSSIA